MHYGNKQNLCIIYFIPKILLFLSDFKLLLHKFMYFQTPKKYISIFYFFYTKLKYSLNTLIWCIKNKRTNRNIFSWCLRMHESL